MLSRDFSSSNSTPCQLQHKTLPPFFEFANITPNNTLTESHYLVQHEDTLPALKNDSHSILAGYGWQKCTLCYNGSANTIKNIPLDSFSFNSLLLINHKFKRPV